MDVALSCKGHNPFVGWSWTSHTAPWWCCPSCVNWIRWPSTQGFPRQAVIVCTLYSMEILRCLLPICLGSLVHAMEEVMTSMLHGTRMPVWTRRCCTEGQGRPGPIICLVVDPGLGTNLFELRMNLKMPFLHQCDEYGDSRLWRASAISLVSDSNLIETSNSFSFSITMPY